MAKLSAELELIAVDNEAPDTQLAARVCWHYYKEGQTQEDVAQRLGLTRKRVNQIIGWATSSGLVQISIDSRFATSLELESRLCQTFGLRRAIVVPGVAAGQDIRASVGAAAGRYVSERLGPGDAIAIAWGGTIHAAAQNISRRPSGNTVISLVGGLSNSGAINPYDNAASFARVLGAQCRYITAPMIAESPSLRDALLASPDIAETYAAACKSAVALLSAVDLTEQSKSLEYGVLSREAWQSLRQAGAVGDVAGHYLDRSGNPVVHPIADRTIRMDLPQLRAIEEIVLAAGGMHKVAIVQAAILAGLCHVLITDEALAAALLEKAQ